MSTTSVYPDHLHPQQFPPPMNPAGYMPQATGGIDIMHTNGTLDPLSIPQQNIGPVPNNPGVQFAQPPAGSDLRTVVDILVQNQTGLQQSQSAFQQQLLSVMHEVAHRPNVVAASEPALHAPRGNTIKLRNARMFNGKHNEVTPFLSEVNRHIEFAPASFPNDHSKVLFVGLNLKDGIPVEWFNQLERSGSSLLHNWNNFLAAFRKKFADPSLVKNADNRLDALKQTGSAHSYLTSFIDIASHLDMTEETKIFRFMKGLKAAVKDSLVPIVDRPKTLDAWEPIIISIDNNLHQRELERRQENKASSSNKKKDSSVQNSYPTTSNTSKNTSSNTDTTSTSDDNAMDVDAISTAPSASSVPRGPISKAERERRIRNDLCLYCGGAGHKVNECLKRKYAQEQGKAQKSKAA